MNTKRSNSGRWSGLIFSVSHFYSMILVPQLTRLTPGEPPSTLDISLGFCQLLLHRTAMRTQWESERFIPEIIQTSRLIISKFLQLDPFTALNRIDHVFSMVCYAAVTLCDFYVVEPLIDQIQVFLFHIAPSDDHVAYRFACIISEVKRRCSNYADATGSASTASTSATDLSRLNAIKQSPFAGSSSPFGTGTPQSPGVSLDQVPFIPPVMDVVDADSYGTLNQLVPEFMPSHSTSHPHPIVHAHAHAQAHPPVHTSHPSALPGGVFHNVPLTNGIPVSVSIV